MSFDTLQEKIIARKNPTVAGLDPKPEQIPPHILKAAYAQHGETLAGAAEADTDTGIPAVHPAHAPLPGRQPGAGRRPG